MQVLIIAALVAVTAASAPYAAPAYSSPAYAAKGYSAPAYEARRPHDFAWEVKDDYTYVNMGQKEHSSGKGVAGSYHVTLPDGRLQTVTYKDDGYGLVADVSHSTGYATPAYSAPAYTAPAYSAPAYTAPAYNRAY